jgi:hypothetical protein
MEEPTCGKGVAAHATMPATLADLISAVADNLEVHMRALDLSDEAAKLEHRAYQKLTNRHRKAEARLRRLSEQMASYRDLPMGRHDEVVLSMPETAAALEKLVKAEKSVIALLQERVDEFEAMLSATGKAAGPKSSASTRKAPGRRKRR